MFWSHLSICVDADRSRMKKRRRMKHRMAKDPMRHLVYIPRETPFDPYGIPITDEISDKLVDLHKDSKKFVLRIDGKLLRYAFVSKCCRVNQHKHGWSCEL